MAVCCDVKPSSLWCGLGSFAVEKRLKRKEPKEKRLVNYMV